MKKLSIIFGIVLLSLFGIFYGIANQEVIITAIVGNINHSPVILNINPNDNPRLLKRNKIQKYIVYFKDDEKDLTNFTITSSSGFVSPNNGIVNSFDSSSGAYINFTYITPSLIPTGNLDKITLTLSNSGATSSGIVVKDLNIYVY